MRLELTRVGLLVELANHYTTRGASRNKDDDNTINKSRYAVKQKTQSEREASSNNYNVDMPL